MITEHDIEIVEAIKKDIELIDHTLGRIAQAGDMEIEIEARDLERLCKLAQEQVKNCSIPDVVKPKGTFCQTLRNTKGAKQ